MLKIKTPNFVFGSFYSSLKNALLKKKNTFVSYICNLTTIVCLFLLKKRYFINVELFQLDEHLKKKGHLFFITINYSEDINAFNNISLLYKKGRTQSYTYSQLLYLRKTRRINLILLTSFGVLNMSEAIMYKIGGVPLLELF
jgi:ribosomal protein S8